MKGFRKLVGKMLNYFGYGLVNLEFEAFKKNQYDEKLYKKIIDVIPAICAAEKEKDLMWNFISFAGMRLQLSNSQIMQDLLVLYIFKEKREGFFVEFGATDGLYLSNTFLLEKQYGWKGILSEPALVWHNDLYNNRTCHIETSCVWRTTGDQLIFNETLNPEISTVDSFSNSDSLSTSRIYNKKYKVESISLNDLLIKYNAPSFIDYISLDTEGSESEILSAFDFNKYSFGLITVEHNFSTNRDKIYGLLTANGYIRIFEPMSMYDDWYVNNSFYANLFNN